MTTEDQKKLAEVLKNVQTSFDKTLGELVTNINNNEQSISEQWSERFNEFKVHVEAQLTAAHDRVDYKLRQLEDAAPKRDIIEPQRLVVQLLESSGKSTEVSIHAQHRKFPDLLLDIRAGHNIYNYGPTGGGKTVAVYTVGRTLSLPVYRIVCHRETSPYVFKGYMKDGVYCEGLAFKPFTEGGILFVDELDNASANAATSLKEFADADEVFFPHGLFPKHKDFRLVANANTIGNGANQTYVGRNQMDKALLNIFKFHYWEYDEDFETTICWQEFLECGGKPESRIMFDKFLKSLREFRRAISELGLLHIISPRNCKQASKDYALGRPLPHIVESIILKGLDEGQTTKIIEKVKSYNPAASRASTLQNLYGGGN